MKRACRVLLLAALGLAGCDSPQRTTDSLKKEIADFKAFPDDRKQEAIDRSFAKLDGQIRALEKAGRSTQAAEFRRQEAALRSDYQTAKLARTIQDAKRTIEGFGQAVKQGAEEIKNAFSSPEPATNR